MLREWHCRGLRSFALPAMISISVVSIGNASLYQKYFDFPPLLITCLIMFQADNGMRDVKRRILFLYCLCFIAYTLEAATLKGVVLAPL